MKISNFLYASAAITMSSGLAYAVTQGTTGATSTGTVDVQMIVLEEVKVSNLADIDLGTFVPDGTDEVSNVPFCIYYGNSANVDLTLTSANSAGPGFQMINGTDVIPYTAEVDNNPVTGTGGITYVAHAEAATVQYGVADTGANDDCAASVEDTTSIQLTVTDAGAPLAVPNATYLDTITLLVAPNP